MYNKTVKDIQGFEPKINIKYAIIAYIFVIISLFYVAIPFTMNYINKNDEPGDKLYKSILYGGRVGLSIYGIYNFTCKLGKREKLGKSEKCNSGSFEHLGINCFCSKFDKFNF